MLSTSISSSRATRESGTAFGSSLPARNISSDVWSSLDVMDWASCSASASLTETSPVVAATPLGSRIMMTLPSPRMVLPE